MLAACLCAALYVCGLAGWLTDWLPPQRLHALAPTVWLTLPLSLKISAVLCCAALCCAVLQLKAMKHKGMSLTLKDGSTAKPSGGKGRGSGGAAKAKAKPSGGGRGRGKK